MHLCGVLSPRAVDMVVGQPAVVGIVLSPCCFPSKKLLDIRVEAGSNDTVKQYGHWCKILAGYIAPQMSGVENNVDPGIKSDRNGVILGWRTPDYTPPPQPTIPMFIFGEMWATKYGGKDELDAAAVEDRDRKKQERRRNAKSDSGGGGGGGVSSARPSRMARRPPQHFV